MNSQCPKPKRNYEKNNAWNILGELILNPRTHLTLLHIWSMHPLITLLV